MCYFKYILYRLIVEAIIILSLVFYSAQIHNSLVQDFSQPLWTPPLILLPWSWTSAILMSGTRHLGPHGVDVPTASPALPTARTAVSIGHAPFRLWPMRRKLRRCDSTVMATGTSKALCTQWPAIVSVHLTRCWLTWRALCLTTSTYHKASDTYSQSTGCAGSAPWKNWRKVSVSKTFSIKKFRIFVNDLVEWYICIRLFCEAHVKILRKVHMLLCP